MKHIKRRIEFLKEAFNSETISSAVKWLEKSKEAKSKAKFIDDLKALSKEFDFPIESISDEYVSFLKKKKALGLRDEVGEVHNPYGIYCLKYWFSNEYGYLGYTATPKKDLEINQKIKHTDSCLSDHEIDFITQHVKNPETGQFVTTGTLEDLEDYGSLKTGQKIICYLNDDSIHSLCFATVIVEGDCTYAIQDSVSGGTPTITPRSEWSRFGRCSWLLIEDEHILEDHSKICIYEESDAPLSKKKIKTDEEDPKAWNLRADGFSFYRHDKSSKNMLETADFAIVVFLDELLVSDFPEKSKTEKERKIAKSGVIATKGTPFGLKDDEIRKINIEKRANELISRMGIKPDLNLDLKNLQKMVSKIYCEKYAYVRLKKKGTGPINEMIENLSYLISASNMALVTKDVMYKRFVDEYYGKMVNFYNRISKECFDATNLYKINEKSYFEKFKGTDKIVLLEKIKELNDLLYDKIKSFPIDTIEDLSILQIKLNSIYRISPERREFNTTTSFNNIIFGYNDADEIKYKLNAYDYEGNFERDVLAVKNIKKLIQSLFR